MSRAWANQSWVWNWIQDAASRFSVVAGVNSLRRISVRLIVCGLGVISPGIASGNALSSDTFRPNRVPAIPMSGSSSALYEPSGVRNRSAPTGHWAGVTPARRRLGSGVRVSVRFLSRSWMRNPTMFSSATGTGSLCHGRRLFRRENPATKVRPANEGLVMQSTPGGSGFVGMRPVVAPRSS